jgi:hypothetical protein
MHPDQPPSAPLLVVKRWSRYGKERLYVETDAGERVGWLDLLTGAATLDRPDLAAGFQQAVSAYQPETSAPPVEASAPAIVEPPACEPVWQDLASNRPGQAVRAEAESLLAEMKERSKVRTFLARAVDAKTDERAFRIGAAGEEAVGPRLERLTRRGWHVLHAIPVGDRGSDIDHLLIGPGGVYTVNTKNHPGKQVWVGEHAILVSGQKTSYLRNSRFEAERVRKALLQHLEQDLPVRAVLVFLTGTVIPQVTIKKMPEDVIVLDRMDVPGVFKRAPQRMDSATVEQVYEVARRSTTWISQR